MAISIPSTSTSTSPADSHKASLDGQTENQPLGQHHQAQQQPLEPSSNPPPPPSSSSEFDPCANARITSPFYLYNHDSPSDCSDSKSREVATAAAAAAGTGSSSGGGSSVTVKDLEAQQTDEDLTPTVTGTTLEKRCSSESAKARLWARRSRQSQCLTKKRVSRWKSLPAWQRLTIKLLIGLLLTGLVVGVAVGVSLRVNGGVYKNSNQSTNIH